jgi:hypothetical protein
MTVAVAINLSDGVILGVDSAVTIPNPYTGIPKILEHADKLFQIQARPIGVATFGLGALGNRSIGSHLREMQVDNPDPAITGDTSLESVVEAMKRFFAPRYRQYIIDPLLQETNDLSTVSNPLQYSLGLVVAGFSFGEYLSEVWQLSFTLTEPDGEVQSVCDKGDFKSAWFASPMPIGRLIKGYDARLVDPLVDYCIQLLHLSGTDQRTEQEQQRERDRITGEVVQILNGAESPVPFNGMPIKEGIVYARFLIDVVAKSFRFGFDLPTVGGSVKIGMVTYSAVDNFLILEEGDANYGEGL